MDITFNCDKCGQHIAIDEAGAGQLVDCPKCKTPMEVPYKSRPPVPSAPPPMPTPRMPSTTPASPPQVSDTKKCPFCAETIKAEAKGCRFCGYDLVTGKPAVRGADPASGRASSPLSKILVVLVIIAAMVGGFFFYHFWKDRPLATMLEGEVFVVTKGGQNYKLGLVTVGLQKADTMKQRLDINAEFSVKERKAYEATKATEKAASEKWQKSNYGSDEYREYIEAKKKASEAQEEYEDLLVSLSFLSGVFDTPFSTKTDADGHFSMPVPSSGPFVLTARAERDVGNKVERYYWVFPLPPPDRGKVKVTLSNDNLTSPAKIVDFSLGASSSHP